MKTVIVAVNSRYSHSSLAPWYMKAYCGEECGDIKVLEFTVNDNPDAVLSSIYREKADIAAFSCYIWNIGYVLRLAENLKKVAPGTIVVLGGPEVSFDTGQVMETNPSVDFIISGEGEVPFKLLVGHLKDGTVRVEDIPGLTRRDGKRVVSGLCPHMIPDLDSIPSPYTAEMLATLKNRTVYLESSRGCPFSCSYCLSSTFEGVRYFSMDRVRADLTKLIESGVTQVKFVDRTFNANRKRAAEIFRFIIDFGRIEPEAAKWMNFHFEMAADLLDEQMMDMLPEAPEGLIQFEIGIQTTNEATLQAVCRKTDIGKAFSNVEKLMRMGNIHIHLDLIAGLPLEGFESFKNSFNDVCALRPHTIQLGFLKLLKGSGLREEADRHGYRYRSYPPYEVLANRYLQFEEMTVLKNVEVQLERYYNSGRFVKSLDFITSRLFKSPFDFYAMLSNYYMDAGRMDRPVSVRDSYTMLLEFIRNTFDIHVAGFVCELLKLDFLSSDNSRSLPPGLESYVLPGFRDRRHAFLGSETNLEKYLPGFKGEPVKNILKHVHFEAFRYDVTGSGDALCHKQAETVVLFNYGRRSRVTGLYDYRKVEQF